MVCKYTKKHKGFIAKVANISCVLVFNSLKLNYLYLVFVKISMTAVRKIFPSYTYTDYLRWEGRWELVDGIAYDMSPMPSPRHQKYASRLNVLIQQAIDDSDCQCYVSHPIDIKMSENTVVNPDLLVVCEDIKGQYYERPPKVVVEILSPSSRLYDTITKYDLYQQFGVLYYLVIDPMEEVITLHELLDGAYVSTIDKAFTLTLEVGCMFDLDLSTIFE